MCAVLTLAGAGEDTARRQDGRLLGHLELSLLLAGVQPLTVTARTNSPRTDRPPPYALARPMPCAQAPEYVNRKTAPHERPRVADPER